jgi:hypothetical protein
MKDKKNCSKCKKELSLNNFYKDRSRKNGLDFKCKKCRRIADRNKRLKNLELYRLKDKENYKKYRDKIRKRKKEWYKKNKYKNIAHNEVRKALRKGLIKRKNKCERCDRETAEAHHEDYSKPLEVIWLCHYCHKNIHFKK